MAQSVRLEEFLSDIQEPTILAGDFDSTPGDVVMTHLAQSWTILEKGDDHLTFPSYAPDREIDYVLVRPGNRFEVSGQRLLDEPVASDHRPLVVDLILKD